MIIVKPPGLEAGLSGSLGARNGQTTLSMVATGLGLISILIFALMASLFRSYGQGFIVIMTIPNCIAAAVAGHIVIRLTSVFSAKLYFKVMRWRDNL